MTRREAIEATIRLWNHRLRLARKDALYPAEVCKKDPLCHLFQTKDLKCPKCPMTRHHGSCGDENGPFAQVARAVDDGGRKNEIIATVKNMISALEECMKRSKT